MLKPTLLIHGGACSQLTDPTGSEATTATAALHQALTRGSAVLDQGGSALDAVQTAVATLEESGALNAGRGAVCDADGKRLLDAMLMDGANHGIGAVAGVQHLRNPIILARAVLDQTRHCLLIGTGAERLADERGLARVSEDWFCAPPPNQPVAHGTVGAVSSPQFDRHGYGFPGGRDGLGPFLHYGIAHNIGVLSIDRGIYHGTFSTLASSASTTACTSSSLASSSSSSSSSSFPSSSSSSYNYNYYYYYYSSSSSSSYSSYY